MRDAQNPAQLDRIPLQSLTERMRHLHEENTWPDAAMVEDVVTAVLDTMDGRLSPTEALLLREVAGLGRIIEEAKAGIAEVSLDAIRGSHIPLASGELGAIVEQTADATNRILESCELLEKLAGSLDRAQADIITEAVTQIYEACTFQDITGQRVTKVVRALQAIEAKVLALSNTFASPGTAPGPAQTVSRPAPLPNAGIPLHGPSLPNEAMCQNDIDDLLADFG